MDKKELHDLFPELELIRSEEIREKCEEIWIEVLEKSTWGKANQIGECPLALDGLTPDCPEKVLAHIRRVTRLCSAVADELADYFEKIGPCNKDYLVAAASIHDVTKFWEYDLNEDGTITHDPLYGKYYHHPVSGAFLAKEHGLPDEIVYAVMAHSDYFSPGGAKAPHMPESYLMKALDDITYKIADPVEYTILDTPDVQQIVVKDEKKPIQYGEEKYYEKDNGDSACSADDAFHYRVRQAIQSTEGSGDVRSPKRFRRPERRREQRQLL